MAASPFHAWNGDAASMVSSRSGSLARGSEKMPVIVRSVVGGVGLLVAGGSVGESAGVGLGLSWSVDAPPHITEIVASESRMTAQAIRPVEITSASHPPVLFSAPPRGRRRLLPSVESDDTRGESGEHGSSNHRGAVNRAIGPEAAAGCPTLSCNQNLTRHEGPE